MVSKIVYELLGLVRVDCDVKFISFSEFQCMLLIINKFALSISNLGMATLAPNILKCENCFLNFLKQRPTSHDIIV